MQNPALVAEDITQGIVLATTKPVHVTVVTPSEQ
jgi:hypothetical protein